MFLLKREYLRALTRSIYDDISRAELVDAAGTTHQAKIIKQEINDADFRVSIFFDSEIPQNLTIKRIRLINQAGDTVAETTENLTTGAGEGMRYTCHFAIKASVY